MIPKLWVQENRKHLVCVDSYTDGVLKGRFFDPFQEVGSFDSLSQFLIRMEEILDGRQEPQSYTEARTFSSFLETAEWGETTSLSRRGNRATFELQILFRQHTSWQGMVRWKEQHQEQRFRSVLELILLMDSALRETEGRVAV